MNLLLLRQLPLAGNYSEKQEVTCTNWLRLEQWESVRPNMLLYVRLRCAESEKPAAYAASVRDILPCAIIRIALNTRCHRT